MRKFLISVFTGAFIALSGAAAAAEPIRGSDNLVMVVGESVELTECSRANRGAQLFYRIDKFWVRLAVSSVVRDRSYCKDRNLPFKHSYKFKVPAGYQSVEPAAKYTKMLMRTVGQGQMPKLFTVTVFKSIAEREAALGVVDISATAITDWSKCLYNGEYLVGRVKVVTYDADYRVQLVNRAANLIVYQTDSRATICGQWQFVNTNYDFSIQLVNTAADFTISIAKKPGPKK
jgi:hypothetical protein